MSFRRWLCDPGFSGYRWRFIPLAALIAFSFSFGETGPQDPSHPSAPPPRKDADPRSPEFEAASYGSSAFAEAASRQGMAVPPEAVAGRLEIYKKLYPGKEVDAARVERILLAEKYLAAKGIGAGDDESDRALAGKWDSSRFATPEEAEQAKSAVRFQLLLDGAETKREAAKMRDLAQIERQSRYRPEPQWEPLKLQVMGDPEECLAWSGPACFLTTQEYNAACTQFQVPAQLSLDSAKSTVLRRYLLEKRRAELARKLGFEHQSDSILERIRMIREGDRWMRSARRYGLPVYDNALLQAAYGKYHSQYFAAREKVTLALIGSTDSAYIDSLHRVFTAWEKTTEPGRGLRMRKAKTPGLPWAYFEADDLPMELAAPADSLRIGQASKPFRTPYGFFFIRLAKVAHTGEIPLSQAIPRLTFLATRDKFLDMDSVIEAQARAYYAENQVRYSVPDTLGLRAWLIPGAAKAATVKPGGKSKPPILPDTALFKPVAAASLLLPAETRIQLQEAARKDSTKAFVGPLPDKYGQWYFRILSRKPSHRVLPFRLVRKDILERISAPIDEMNPGMASGESISEVLLNIGLSEAYQQEAIRKSDPSSHPDPLAKGDQDKAITADMARMRAEQAKYDREEEELLSGTKVNRSIFFR